jgi:trk system potassium uptake protein TrkH
MGITGDLNSQGRLLIIVTMLSGRVGPLTLLALFSRPDRPGRVQWPEDTLPIG